MTEKQFCFKVVVNPTNAGKHAFSTGDYEDSTARHDYLDCIDSIVYVKANSFEAVSRLLGPNIVNIEKIGICY